MTRRSRSRIYSWQEILPNMEEIRSQATDQFIEAWRASQSNKPNRFVWHETTGYLVVKFDDEHKRAVLSPRAADIIEELGQVAEYIEIVRPRFYNDKKVYQQKGSSGSFDNWPFWRPGHSRFSIRCTPEFLRSFSLVQLAFDLPKSLKERRDMIKKRLKKDEAVLTISQFPLFGAGIYLEGQEQCNGPILRSKMLSDNTLTPYPQLIHEINGIINRRGAVPNTAIPVFRDLNTPWPFVDPVLPHIPTQSQGDAPLPHLAKTRDSVMSSSADEKRTDIDQTTSPKTPKVSQSIDNPTISETVFENLDNVENSIFVDSPLFGIGSGGVLRVSLCAADLEEARVLYDHLAPVCAIMIALTASTPIVRGYLVDRDCYWDTQCGAVDDRTAQERGIEPITTAKGKLQKSRFGTIDMYLGPGKKSRERSFRHEFNNRQFQYDTNSYFKMKDKGVDELLARHVSMLFIRDIHYASKKMLNKKHKKKARKVNKASSSNSSGSTSGTGSNTGETGSTDVGNGKGDGQVHFRRFLGCNRQNVCLYPPNRKTGSGWEVEFMSMEVQITDDENAALITFIVLLSRAILSFNLNLYLPITLMDENMKRAQSINAVAEQAFLFRRNMFGGRDGGSEGSGKVFCRKDMTHLAEESTESEQVDECDGNSDSKDTLKGSSKAENDDRTGDSETKAEQSEADTNEESKEYLEGVEVATNSSIAEYIELTLDEIINGSEKYGVVGLMNIIHSYLNTLHLEAEVDTRIRKQLQLIEKRSKGQILTLASWIRKFVKDHPDYAMDSVIPQTTNYDLLRTLSGIEDGSISAPDLLG